jgi:hypothetical protein
MIDSPIFLLLFIDVYITLSTSTVTSSLFITIFSTFPITKITYPTAMNFRYAIRMFGIMGATIPTFTAVNRLVIFFMAVTITHGVFTTMVFTFIIIGVGHL